MRFFRCLSSPAPNASQESIFCAFLWPCVILGSPLGAPRPLKLHINRSKVASGICKASHSPPDPLLGDFWTSKCVKKHQYWIKFRWHFCIHVISFLGHSLVNIIKIFREQHGNIPVAVSAEQWNGRGIDQEECIKKHHYCIRFS